MSQAAVAVRSPVRAQVWPLPEAWSQEMAPAVVGLACQARLLNGNTVEGAIKQFAPEKGRIVVESGAGAATFKITAAHLKMLRLLKPLALALPEGKKAGSLDVPYSLILESGETLDGKTRGVVHAGYGTFLFDVEEDDRLVMPIFVPSLHIRDLKTGASPAKAEVAAVATPAVPKPLKLALVDTQSPAAAGVAVSVEKDRGNTDFLAERAVATPEELVVALSSRSHLRSKPRLGEILLRGKLINQAQLDEALARQAKDPAQRIGTILVDMGVVSLHTIQIALAETLGIPYVNVREFWIDPAMSTVVPEVVAQRLKALPLMMHDGRLVVAVPNPLAGDFTSDLRFACGRDIIPVVADPAAIESRLRREYMPSFRYQETAGASADRGQVIELAEKLAREVKVEDAKAKPADGGISENTLVKLVNKMIHDASSMGASDIHVEANNGNQNMQIRFRKDGELMEYLELSPAYRGALVSRIKVMAELDISERRAAQDGKIDFSKHGTIPIELRVAVIPTSNGLEDVVLRLLSAAEALPLEKVGFEPPVLEQMRQMAHRSYGLILVCGPTGSGKSTTLHSMLKHVNNPTMKIWTAEDPIEITQKGLRQVQVNRKTGWTFAAAMTSFLRADPDIIMVGEMRDTETAKVGIEASLTGHLVMSTLHTNSAAESVTRLLDLGMDPFNFGDALVGVCSQRLARKLCPACKKPHVLDDQEAMELATDYASGTGHEPAEVLRALATEFGKHGKLAVYEPSPEGCAQCSGGWRGRVGVFEVLVSDPSIKALIHRRAPSPEIYAAARASGMQTLRQDALIKALRGQIDLRTARAVSD